MCSQCDNRLAADPMRFSVFFCRLIGIMDKLKRNYIVWQDIFDNGVKVITSPDLIFYKFTRAISFQLRRCQTEFVIISFLPWKVFIAFDFKFQLKNSTVINIWIGGWKEEMKKVTQIGHKAILSACWYLNYINYGMDWPEVSYQIEYLSIFCLSSVINRQFPLAIEHLLYSL